MKPRLLALSILLLSLISCQKGNDTVIQTPTITTKAIVSLSSTSLQSGGEISSQGGSAVTARGVCWATTENPTVSNSKTVDGTGTGSFSSTITGLLPNTLYYIRAYATNSYGTAYGNQVSLTTANPIVYVAGSEEIATTSIYSLAKLWTDGQATNITAAPNFAEALSVFVSGSDVYTAGYESPVVQGTASNNIAKLWKNGVGTNLTN